MGNDVMWGVGGTASGTNNDVFYWQRGDAGTGASDQIRDFNPWNSALTTPAGMKVDLSGLLENRSVGSTTNLSQWITSITTGAASSTQAATLNNEMNTLVGDSLGTTLAATKMVIDIDGAGAGTATQTIYFRNWSASTTAVSQWVANGWLVV